jgi:hypothetical protein
VLPRSCDWAAPHPPWVRDNEWEGWRRSPVNRSRVSRGCGDAERNGSPPQLGQTPRRGNGGKGSRRQGRHVSALTFVSARACGEFTTGRVRQSVAGRLAAHHSIRPGMDSGEVGGHRDNRSKRCPGQLPRRRWKRQGGSSTGAGEGEGAVASACIRHRPSA